MLSNNGHNLLIYLILQFVKAHVIKNRLKIVLKKETNVLRILQKLLVFVGFKSPKLIQTVRFFVGLSNLCCFKA